MKPRATIAAIVGALTAAGAGVFMGLSGGTLAAFSDTVSSTPTTIGAATVVLGHSGGGPDLRYQDLARDRPQTVMLSVDYQGSIPADLSLSIAPGGGAALCEPTKKNGGWTARQGAVVTLAVGSDQAISYCSLYDGTKVTLARAVAPGTKVVVPITVTLKKNEDSAKQSDRGLTQQDIVTVYADAGFTDRASGKITIAAAGQKGGDTRSSLAATPTALAVADPGTATGAIAPDPADPSAAARSAPAATPIQLPAECARAGMKADDFAEVITVDPVTRRWNALEARGAGAGPFLILGTAGDDTIVGSSGADCIVGGAGHDTISGGGGADVVIGGPDGATCDVTPAARTTDCAMAPKATVSPSTSAPAPKPGAAPAPESAATDAPAPAHSTGAVVTPTTDPAATPSTTPAPAPSPMTNKPAPAVESATSSTSPAPPA